MRCFSLLATFYAATVGTTSALVDIADRPWVEVAASGWDERTSGNGCSPGGCIPENTLDHSRSTNSRWSCKGDILDDANEGCWIEYSFYEPHNIAEIEIAFHRGTENTRTLKVYTNGAYHSKITSSGETNRYQTFELDTDETETVRLYLDDWEDNSDVWLSITEVNLVVE